MNRMMREPMLAYLYKKMLTNQYQNADIEPINYDENDMYTPDPEESRGDIAEMGKNDNILPIAGIPLGGYAEPDDDESGKVELSFLSNSNPFPLGGYATTSDDEQGLVDALQLLHQIPTRFVRQLIILQQ